MDYRLSKSILTVNAGGSIPFGVGVLAFRSVLCVDRHSGYNTDRRMLARYRGGCRRHGFPNRGKIKIELAADSPLEGAGFEPSVPHGQNRNRSRQEPKVRIQLPPAESRANQWFLVFNNLVMYDQHVKRRSCRILRQVGRGTKVNPRKSWYEACGGGTRLHDLA